MAFRAHAGTLPQRRNRALQARIIEEVGLGDRAGNPMHSFSGGMKRLLNLACGIVHRPSVLLLDEPTVSVDLQSREQLLALIRHYADAGAGVIYSTHYMEEAERICDRVLSDDSRQTDRRGRPRKGDLSSEAAGLASS